MTMTRMKIGLAAAFVALSGGFAAAQDFVVGMSGAMTGPTASTYAPTVDAMRIYFDRVNRLGGINGHKVKFIALDDQGSPSRAATNVRRFLTQDNVQVLVGAGPSATIAPMITESERAGVPLVFAGSVCPQESYPPTPKETVFCTTSFGVSHDNRAMINFINEKYGNKFKIAFAAMAIPVSRTGIDIAEARAKELGMTSVGQQVIPPATPDYTPFATKLLEGQPDWGFSWAPWIVQVKSFEAMRRLGWKGRFMTWAHIEAENEMARLKDPGLVLIGANALFSENLPIHQEIAKELETAKSQYPVNQMGEGWVAGMVIEAALRAAGKPDPKAITAAMKNLKVDTKGLRGGPLEWTPDNHFRTKQHYRFYAWDAGKDRMDTISDWITYDIK
ncbi:MAG: ABC transporter substrate-binding protein [Pseudorhodoplanes sp.]|uniref:ABC transporter substrate-binding protein n=1 Tax=Pseudorhodoplanes sp. TaxID=1934341 RepID=UPI003D0D4520